jgi:large subunit ribosomal protein L9|tara:strand:- start:812 stop:1264 length:453 start_codon:yes stop_codon:yes gene_type:complete
MKLILNSDVKSLGRKGDVVDVAKGYARNYLLPKKLAVVANSSNLKFAEALREKREIQAVANNELAESIKTALADAKIVISQNTTDEGTLYAAVSNEQIVDAIETFSGFRLEAEQIDVENQVKEIGLHSISIVLGPDAKFETTLEIIPETK